VQTISGAVASAEFARLVIRVVRHLYHLEVLGDLIVVIAVELLHLEPVSEVFLDGHVGNSAEC